MLWLIAIAFILLVPVATGVYDWWQLHRIPTVKHSDTP